MIFYLLWSARRTTLKIEFLPKNNLDKHVHLWPKYTILDSYDGDTFTAVRIEQDDCDYNGVICRYYTVKFNGKEILVDFSVEQIPAHLEKDTSSAQEIEWSEEFREIVECIALDIICQQTEK